MRRSTFGLMTVLMVSTTACFHQIVNTGRTPSATVVEMPWVSTWLWGLVPATPIDVRSQCPTGVAIIETQQSFANGLVGGLTLGIWTPQSVRVTCASGTASVPSGSAEITIAPHSSDAQRNEAIQQAIRQSGETRRPVIIRF